MKQFYLFYQRINRMAKKKTKVTNKTSCSLTEFRAWLEGVEEMQEANWAPDATQWKVIRAKINAVVADEVPIAKVAVVNRAAPPRAIAQPTKSSLGQSLPVDKSALSNAPIATQDGMQLTTPDIDTSGGDYSSPFA